MSQINLSITVDDAHLKQILEVAQALKSAGMNVEQVMDAVGVITGSCDEQEVETLSQVEGVLNVEPQQDYQLAPPNADVQ